MKNLNKNTDFSAPLFFGEGSGVRIIHNAVIITMDDALAKADAMVINDLGKIEAIGTATELRNQFGSFKEEIDFQGKVIIPGLNDAHIHVWKIGHLRTYMLDVRGIKSIVEFKQKLKDFAAKNPNSEWIMARGINEMVLEEKRLPTKEDLDEVITDRPVFVIRTCAHIGIANSKAIEISGVSEATEVPFGGEIRKNQDGSLQGIFTERALGLIMNHIPPFTFEEYKNMILEAHDYLLSLGITSATDPAANEELLAAYIQLDAAGLLKVRMNVFPLRIPDGSDEIQVLPERYESEFLQIKTVKFFSDGGLSSATAALNVPYKNTDGYKGVLRLDYDKFYDTAKEAVDKGFSVATHAIGHQAIDLTLKVYSDLFEIDPTLRHRIEHVGFLSQDNINDFKRMNMTAAMQPIFIYELANNFKNTLTDELLEVVYPCKTVLDNGINLALSTDGPVVKQINPWVNIETAITRKAADGSVIGKNQKITLQQALYAYTQGSAVADNLENVKGSLTVGKFADFIILNKNPFELEDVSDVETLETWVSGKLIHKK
ncbi:amidohydrolase [Flavobacterium succinicans]|uniref:N-substituted formamide deformylase n=1 Tax=Flavobacterium succinicans TaxID=29536 RepID=A0A199XU27_9FLAO|nr:amidohydrolase [Flavobacterium succinicans]OAZ04741.1 N-substituted formamide deformylase precursor [Flavobacterium succinicans]